MRYSKSFLLGTNWKGGEDPLHPIRGIDCFLSGLLGGDNPSQTTVNTPYGDEQWDEFKQGASDWYQGPGAQLIDEPMTAPRNELQTGAEQGMQNFFINDGGFQGGLQAGQQGANDLMSNPYGGTNYSDLTSNPAQYGLTNANANPALQQQLSGDPFQNPALENTIQSVQRGQLEDYNRNIAPMDRTAINYNQPGGSSRGSLLQARSQDDLMENMDQVRASMTFGGYENALRRQDLGIGNQMGNERLGEQSRATRANEGLNRYLGGTQGAGQTADTANRGYAGVGAFGDARRGFEQEQADERTFRWDYDQNQPQRALQQYGGHLSRLPGGGTQTTTMDDGTTDLGQAAQFGLGMYSLM